MKKLSYWAKSHPHAAQALITIGHFIIIYLSIQIGILLLSMGIELHKGLIFILIELLTLTIWLYPSKKDYAQLKDFYVKRRFFNLGVLTIGALLTIVGANRMTSEALDTTLTHHNSFINTAPAKNYALLSVYQSTSTVQTTSIKGQFFNQNKNVHQNWLQKRLVKKYQSISKSEMPEGLKIFLTILLVVGLLAAEYGLAFLACSLACNEMGALAVVVLIGGLTGLALLVSAALRGIFPDMEKKKRTRLTLLMTLLPPVLLYLLSFINN